MASYRRGGQAACADWSSAQRCKQAVECGELRRRTIDRSLRKSRVSRWRAHSQRLHVLRNMTNPWSACLVGISKSFETYWRDRGAAACSKRELSGSIRKNCGTMTEEREAQWLAGSGLREALAIVLRTRLAVSQALLSAMGLQAFCCVETQADMRALVAKQEAVELARLKRVPLTDRRGYA
eukprot:6190389-Pleurochrysis_carterae.AAC.5